MRRKRYIGHPNVKMITEPKKARYGVMLAIPFDKPAKNKIKYKLDELSMTANEKIDHLLCSHFH